MSSRQNQNQRGIDIHQALEILAARVGSTDGQAIAHTTSGGCECCQNAPPSGAMNNNNGATMGKVIDLFGSEDDKDATNSTPSTTTEKEALSQEEIQKQRQERQEKLKEELQTMSLQELMQAVLQAQEERVATYRRYEDGLATVLGTNGNMTQYPSVVAEATASFAVLSDTIRSIQQVLVEKDGAISPDEKEIAQLLQRLQKAEQNKLHLTAALHLEKIRLAGSADNLSSSAPTKSNKKEDATTTTTTTTTTASSDEKINRLYRESVASLQSKIAASVEEINEVLDEIRCTMME